MKKLSIFICLFMSFNIVLNAECDYKMQKELNTLASHVDYNYEYDEESDSFNLIIYNIGQNLKIDYNDFVYNDEGDILIKTIKGGESLKISVLATDNDCEGNKIRILNIRIPFVNPYYNTKDCLLHPDVKVCGVKYLDYELSEKAFQNLIDKDNSIDKQIEKTNEETIKEETTLLDKIYDILNQIYIPVLLVIISSTITYMIFKPIYRKIKHGL